MSEKKLLGCDVCGCTDILETMWVNCNTGLVDFAAGPADDDTFCPRCNKVVCQVWVDKPDPYVPTIPQARYKE